MLFRSNTMFLSDLSVGTMISVGGITANVESIANNEYSPVDKVYPGGGPGEIYNGNDPALKGHFKYQADFYADIIKHLLTIDPVLKTNLFMDPHIISDGKNGPLVPGFYNRLDNLVALFANTDLATFVHESIHAATVHYILAHPNDPKVKQLVQILKASRKNDKRRGKKWGIYGNTNLREFIAESFSNPTFINHLMKIDPIFDKQEAKSLFDNLKTIVRNMLKAMGYKPENIKDRSAFDEVMELSHGLFTGKDLEGYIYDKERLKEPVGDLMRVEDLTPIFESITAEPGADDAQIIELLDQQLYSSEDRKSTRLNSSH